MTKRVFQIRPGIASYVEVKDLAHPGAVDSCGVSVVYLGRDRGAAVGIRNTPLAQCDWPQQLRGEVNQHFARVFALRHEDWREPGPSPRAAYCDSLKPWTVEVNE